jgi:hypothetical protein
MPELHAEFHRRIGGRPSANRGARSCPLKELRAAHESPWKPYHGSTPLKYRNMVCFDSSKSALSGVELSELLSHGLSVRFADEAENFARTQGSIDAGVDHADDGVR